MCRFPGLLTIGGLLLVIGAALLGMAPAAELEQPSAEPVRIALRADFDKFLPPALLSESPREVVRTPAKKDVAQARTLTLVHAERPGVEEVAMTGESEERGPPFRR
ncbi:MAG: hypothetical protein U0792_03530 [Gemmataceae bacterium]